MISEQMKNMIKVCLCLALMWMLFLSIAPRTNASTPLLENGSFESPILADGVIPGWKKGNAAQPTNQHVVTRENSADGEHSFKLVDDSDSTWASLDSNYIAVQQGDVLELSAQIYNMKDRVEIYLRFFDSSYNVLASSKMTSDPQKNNTWANYTISGTAPENTKYVAVRLDSGGAAKTAAYFDDLILIKRGSDEETAEPIEPGRLINPSFEQAVQLDGTIPGWRKLNSTIQTNQYQITSANKYDGSHSLRLTDTSNSNWLALETNFLPADPGELLEVSAMVYNIGDRIQIYLRYMDSGYNLLAQTSVTSEPDNNNTWAEYKVSGTAPENTKYVTIRLDSSNPAVTDAYYDHFILKNVTVPPITDLGPQVNNVGINAAAYGMGPDGEPYIYTINSTSPAQFVVMNAYSGDVITQISIPGTGGSWGLAAAPDGSVYIGTYSSSSFYQWIPGSTELIDYGRPISTENFLFRLVADEDGMIYGGTFPNGKVFRFDPVNKTFRDYGRMGEDIQYVRSTALWKDKIYAGTGALKAQLFEIDKLSGEKREIILPAEYHGPSELYDLVATDDLLFARLTNYNDLLVYDLNTNEWSEVITGIRGLDVSAISDGGIVYMFKSDSKLYAYEYDHIAKKGTLTPTSATHPFGPRSFGWLNLESYDEDLPGKSLVTIDAAGRMFIYNPVTEINKFVISKMQGSPAKINVIHAGIGGRIYTGGYQTGGMSYYDPTTDVSEQFPRGTINQLEGMYNAFGKMYLGVYPGAYIFEYDPAQPYNYGINPKLLFSLKEDGQDRPYAFAEADGMLAIGTIADYGMLEGALTLYDPATGEHTVYKNLIPNHSITSLQYKDGFLYGATTVTGGLGIEPTEAEGKVFIFDMKKRQVIWSGVPIAGEKGVMGITFDNDGYLWGVTMNKIFKFNPDDRNVTSSRDVAYCSWCTTYATHWTQSKIKLSSSGQLLVNILYNVYSIDPYTDKQTLIAPDVYNLEEDNNGTIYYSTISNLIKHEIEQEAPYVVWTSPEDEEGSVSVDTGITVTFNKLVAMGDAWGGVKLEQDEESIEATVTIEGNKLRIKPLQQLKPETEYTVTVPAASVRDKQDHDLKGMLSFLFTTGKKKETEYPGTPSTPEDNSDSNVEEPDKEAGGEAEVEEVESQLPEYHFHDLKGHWAEKVIRKAASLGIVKGYSDGSFRPQNQISRAEFIALLVRALGMTNEKTTPEIFKDVPSHKWYADEVGIAYAAGLIKGNNKNQFLPDTFISREEMAVILVRAYMSVNKNYESGNLDIEEDLFIDAQQVSEWAKTEVRLVHQFDLMQGIGEGKFAPRATTTRAEAVQAIMNLLAP